MLRKDVEILSSEQGNVIRYNQLDPTIEKRVDDLLGQMTLPEKVGQLVQQNPFSTLDWGVIKEKKALAEEQGQPFIFHLELPPEFEAILLARKIWGDQCADVRTTNYLQRLAVEGSRLHIPLLVGSDVIHGFRTIFPIPLAEACTWNPDLIEQAERISSRRSFSLRDQLDFFADGGCRP